MIKKILTIGPESTGKSTLCAQLARHYKTTWCPEYAREYLNQNGVKYGYDDLIKITQRQLMIEDHFTELAVKGEQLTGSTGSPLTAHPAFRHHSHLSKFYNKLIILAKGY